MNRFLQYALIQPSTWLGDSIFRPLTFSREIEIRGMSITAIARRAIVMLRLLLPLFLSTYTSALIVRAILYYWSPQTLNSCYVVVVQCVSHPSILTLLLIAAANTSEGIIVGIVIGTLCSSVLGITMGLALGMVLGVANALAGGVLLAIVLGLVEGVVLGTGESFLALFLAWSLALGIVFGFTGNITMGVGGGIAGGVALSIARGITGNIKNSTWFRFIAGVITGSIGGVVVWHIAGVIAWSTTGEISGFIDASFQSLYATAIFFICYILGYYRLPLYISNCLSLYKAYSISNRYPQAVFIALQRSALYCDEYLFLPLPYLKQILLLAARQDEAMEQLLKAIEFITLKQSRQITAAREAALELILRELEKRDTLSEIAELAEQFVEYLPIEAKPIDPQWIVALLHVQDACRDAARYCSSLPLSKVARLRSLESMLDNLSKVYPDTVSRDVTLTRRLKKVVEHWEAIAEQKQRTLIIEIAASGPIINPYTAGPALELHDRLFVGRSDLVRKLEEALGREKHHPTFFLHGERRMGKSSTLKQLPDLFGPGYIPITYDLQQTGVCSSTIAFLSTIAEGIYEGMSNKRLQVSRFDIETLQEASKENEATIYWYYDKWLKEVENLLEQENCMLLLAFDEFEQLEVAQEYGYLDVNLLLGWFRSIIQNRPRLALLFSGIRTVDEMQGNWTSYFVNAQTHKVSFLQPKEARQLIIPSIPGFLADEIFGEDVVAEILRVTGGHPFLIQAICEKLIDQLNDENRDEARLQDVVQVVEMVLEIWDYYFQDLWNRTDQEQRLCLFALNSVRESDLESIVQQSKLDERTVRRTVQTLLKRDLISHKMSGEREMYAISTPIFRDWVKRNRYT